jgi:hypothetical protein
MESVIRKNAITSVAKIIRDELGLEIETDDYGCELEEVFVIHFLKALIYKYEDRMAQMIDSKPEGINEFLNAIKSADPKAVVGMLIIESTPYYDGVEGLRALDFYNQFISAPLPFLDDLPKINEVYKKCDDLMRASSSLIRIAPVILSETKNRKNKSKK